MSMQAVSSHLWYTQPQACLLRALVLVHSAKLCWRNHAYALDGPTATYMRLMSFSAANLFPPSSIDLRHMHHAAMWSRCLCIAVGKVLPMMSYIVTPKDSQCTRFCQRTMEYWSCCEDAQQTINFFPMTRSSYTFCFAGI